MWGPPGGGAGGRLRRDYSLCTSLASFACGLVEGLARVGLVVPPPPAPGGGARPTPPARHFSVVSAR